MCSPARRAAASAACVRRACQTIARKTAAISGTSVSSCGGSEPRYTAAPIPAAVVIITTKSTHPVGWSRQERNPYTSVRLIQMKWKGIVSQYGRRKIASRFTSEKTAQLTSTTRGG